MDEFIEKSNIEKSEKSESVKPNNIQKMMDNNFENNITTNETKKTKNKIFNSKSSLDKVAQDLKKIIDRLDKPKRLKESPTRIMLRVEDREFFKTENSKKKSKKNSESQKKRISFTILDEYSRNSLNIPSKNELKARKSCTNDTLKVPITKSEMDNFKHEVVVNANAVLKQTHKEKVAEQVKNLMNQALKESEITHKVPIIDVGKFIDRSLTMTPLKTLPAIQNSNKQKTKNENVKQESNTSNEKEKVGKTDDVSIIKSNITIEKKKETNQSKNEKLKGKEFTTQKDNKNNLKNSEKSNSVKNSTNKIIIRNNPMPVKAITKKDNNIISPDGSSRTTAGFSNVNKNKQISIENNKLLETKKIVKNNNKNLSSMDEFKRKSTSSSTIGRVPNNKKTTPVVENVAKNLNNKRQTETNNNNKNKIQRKESCISKQNSSKLIARPSSRLCSRISSRMLKDRLSNFCLLSSSHSYYNELRSREGFNNKNSKNNNNNNNNNVCSDPLIKLRDEVNRAIRDKKTFTVKGNFTAVRRALLKRGWVEKFTPQMKEKMELEVNALKNKSVNELASLPNTNNLKETCKNLIKSKLLGKHQVDLYWTNNYDSFVANFDDKNKFTLVNRFKRDVFSYTSKKGLSEAVKSAHWYSFPGFAQINHPRTFVLSMNGETKQFIKNFRRTAAISLLKWVILNGKTKESKLISVSGKIPLEAFRFAVNECFKMIIEANNQDIDHPLKEACDNEWNQFLEYYYKILHVGNHFKKGTLENEESMVIKSNVLIEKLKPHFPHIGMDGTMNIWILKPACGSQGKGIHICRTLRYIMETVKNNSTTSYIVQKYIERPLLIFNTKFDIRQWFLISSPIPLTIWMYRECYLRFSSQTYNLRKLHESIHLTNNSVQQKYQNLSHDITLPRYNMWDSLQFKNHLSNIGYPDVYNKVIYKGMKECILGAVLIHQDKIFKRSNSFELYGADFMLTEDFEPWLIEINSAPALYASTPVTARMCPQVLEDVIKVVIDREKDPKTKTGLFEMIYKEPMTVCKNNEKMCSLKVCGLPLSSSYFCLDDDKKCAKIKPSTLIDDFNNESQKTGPNLCKSCSELNSTMMKNTLQKLLKFVQDEKNKRQKKPITIGTDPVDDTNNKMQSKKSSSTCTSLSMSLDSLNSQLEALLLRDFGNVNISEDEENLIDEALKMLKEKRNDQVVKCLFGIISTIVNKSNGIIDDN